MSITRRTLLKASAVAGAATVNQMLPANSSFANTHLTQSILDIQNGSSISNRHAFADVDGDQLDEIIEIDGRHLYFFKCDFVCTPVLEHVVESPVKRLIVGDFVTSGREKGKDQVFTISEDGYIRGWAISNDLSEMWWWFTQPSFVADNDATLVGDFDDDGAEEILVHSPSSGLVKLYKFQSNGLLGEMSGYTLGNLAGFDLRNKEILAGNFGLSKTRKDIVVLDRSVGQVIRFDTATDTTGAKTFWWAFTSRGGLFNPRDDIIVANIDGGEVDGLIIRSYETGQYRFLRLDYNDGYLVNIPIEPGQLPVKPRVGKITAARVRDLKFRAEPGIKRDDIVYFDSATNEFTRTDARFDPNRSALTYWWAYTSYVTIEPTRPVTARPWAILLCRFKGLPGDPAIENFFRGIFSPASGGLIEYWHDVSQGAIDIGSSRVFNWIELDIERKDAAIGRAALIDHAIASAQRAGLDLINGFHSQIAVFTHNFTKDGAPPGTDWQDPNWAPFWIDGSADSQGRVSAPPHAHSGSFLAHEMGHGFGFNHDLAADLTTQYGDPNCIMSAMAVNVFDHPKWHVPFGPTMSVPQLALKNWWRANRVRVVDRSWAVTPQPPVFVLSAMSDRRIPADMAVVLPSDAAAGAWSYYLEYQRPIGWNKGISPRLVIRRQVGDTAAFLGQIEVPNSQANVAVWIEPQGQVRFEVEKLRADGRSIRVTAKKVPIHTALTPRINLPLINK